MSKNYKQSKELEVLVELRGRVQEALDFYRSIKNENGYPSVHQAIRIKHALDEGRILVADEVGTGKTVVPVYTKILFDSKAGKRSKVLVICPYSAMAGSWSEQEINSYLPHGNEKVRYIESYEDFDDCTDADFVVINDDKFSLRHTYKKNPYLAKLDKIGFDLVVVDECHNFKNPDSNMGGNLLEYIERHADTPLILMSGTPLPNQLNDIGVILYLLDPKNYPDPKAFDYSYNPDAVKKMLDQHKWFRITKADLKEFFGLPDPPEEKVISVKMNDRLIKKYIDTWKQIISDREKFYRMKQLAKLCLDPALVEPETESEKLKSLYPFLEERRDRGEKVALFTKLREGVHPKLAEQARALYGDSGFVVINGTVTDREERERLSKEFREGDAMLAILTVDTMGEGVKLPTGTTPCSVARLEPLLTPKEMNQTLGRVYRPGQKAGVGAYTFLMQDERLNEIMEKELDHLIETHDLSRPRYFIPGTLDQDIYRLWRWKEMLIQKVYQGKKLDYLERMILETESEYSLPNINPHINVKIRSLFKPESPHQLANKLFEKWKGKGSAFFTAIQKPSHPLHRDWQLAVRYYNEKWNSSASAHTARLIGKMIKTIEEKTGKKYEKIADVGSGPATLSRAILRPTYCIDLSQEMLDIGATEAEKTGVQNTYTAANLTGMPFEEGFFDLAVASYILHYLYQRAKGKKEIREIDDAIMELNRVLAPEGDLVVALPYNIENPSYNHLASQRDVVETFSKGIEKYGFKVIESLTGSYTPSQSSRFPGVHLVFARKKEHADGKYRGNLDDLKLYGGRIEVPSSFRVVKPLGYGKKTVHKSEFLSDFTKDGHTIEKLVDKWVEGAEDV